MSPLRRIAAAILTLFLAACVGQSHSQNVRELSGNRISEAIVILGEMSDGKPRILGEGIVIDRNGTILGAAHSVIDAASGKPFQQLVVGRMTNQGLICSASLTILASDAKLDAVLLRGAAPLDAHCQEMPKSFDALPALDFIDGEKLSALPELGDPLLLYPPPTSGGNSKPDAAKVIGFRNNFTAFPTIVKIEHQLGPANFGGPVIDTFGNFVGIQTLQRSDEQFGSVVAAGALIHWMQYVLPENARTAKHLPDSSGSTLRVGASSDSNHFFVIFSLENDQKSAEAMARRLGGRVVNTNRYTDLIPDHYFAGIGPMANREDAENILAPLLSQRAYKAAYVQNVGEYALHNEKRDLVLNYFMALEEKNGSKALSYVNPGKRSDGVSPASVEAFYGDMVVPVTLLNIDQASDPMVMDVYYMYQRRNEAATYIKAKIYLKEVDDALYIDDIEGEKSI